MGKRTMKTVLGGGGYYIALLLCVAAIGVGGYYALFHTPAEPTGDTTSQEEPLPTQSQEEPQAPVIQTMEPEEVEDQTVPAPQEETETAAPVLDDTPVVAAPPSLIVTPVEGETVAAFSADELQYDATMGDWRTHDGIDIQAPEGTQVLAAEAGTVQSVYEDNLMGTVVVIDHGDGVQTLYASLQPDPAVETGDSVTAGQVIGQVGSTAYAEADRGAHLHFSVTQNGEPTDPEAYLKG